MTTPAISNDITGNPVIPYIDNWNGHNPQAVQNSVRIQESRPASGNSAKDSTGWRFPRGFFHSYSWTPRVPATIVQGYYQGDHDLQFTEVNNFIYDGLYPAGAPPSWLVNKANIAAYSNLKNQRVNLGVMFAERKETAELFTRAVEGIASGVIAFKKKNFSSFLKAARVEGTKRWRQTPQDWLQLQYGWNPLMQDVLGACQALSDKEQNAQAYKIKATGKARWTEEFSVENQGLCSFSTGAAYLKEHVSRKYEVTTLLWYHIVGYLARALSQLGITNPGEIIWERIPYSFVIDWFLPVGNWLSAFDSDLGLNFYTGCTTRFTRGQVVLSARPSTGLGGTICTGAYASGTQRSYWFSREVLTTPPPIGFPSFKNPFSAGHIANAMSLLTQAFRH